MKIILLIFFQDRSKQREATQEAEMQTLILKLEESFMPKLTHKKY